MKKTQNQKIVETLSQGWNCYGQIIAKNEYASSLPRRVAMLREKVDFTQKTVDSLGVLTFENKKYHWCERMDGRIKYFRLFPLVEGTQMSLFEV